MIHDILLLIFWLCIGSLIVFLARLVAMLASFIALYIGKGLGKLMVKRETEAPDSIKTAESLFQLIVWVILGFTIWGKLIAFKLHWDGVWSFLQIIFLIAVVGVILNFFALIVLGALYKDLQLSDD